MGKLRRLVPRYGHQEIDRWQALADARDWPGFVARVLEMHYDPAYARSRGRNYAAPSMRVRVESLLEDGADVAARELVESVAQAPTG